MAEVRVRLRNEANTSTTNNLDTAFDVTFQPRRNGAAVASFKLPNSDAALVADGSVVAFLLDGDVRVGARVVSVDVTEESESAEGIESTTYRCEGLLVDHEESVVQLPSGACDLVPSTDERVFAWFGPDYDVSGWEAATQISLQGWASTFYSGLPAGFTDTGAYWICASDGDEDNAPAGTRPFRRDVSVAVGPKWLEWGADNGADLFVQGKKVGTASDFRKTQQYEFDTTAGVLTLAWAVVNSPDDGPPGGNPTALVWSLREGSPEGTVIAKSDNTTRCRTVAQGIPTVSLGEIWRKCRSGNALLSTWTVTGSDTTDHLGATLPTVSELTFRLYEDTLADVLKVFTDTWFDVVVLPTGKTVRPYLKGTLGDVSTFDLVTGTDAGVSAPGTVNIVDLSWDVQRPKFDRLGVRDASGWFVRGSGDRWGKYRMQQVVDRNVATKLADELLAIYGVEQATASFSYLPLDESTDLPFDAFDLFDTLTVPGPHTGSTDQEVWAITIQGGRRGDTSGTADGGGIIVEVGAPVQSRAELLDVQVSRLGAGALDGVGSAASGGVASIRAQLGTRDRPQAGGPAHCLVSFPEPGVNQTITFPCLFVGKVTSLRLIGEGTTGTSTVTVLYNSITTTLTGTANGLVDYEVIASQTWTTVTWLTITVTAVGHTNLHVYADVTEVGQ